MVTLPYRSKFANLRTYLIRNRYPKWILTASGAGLIIVATNLITDPRIGGILLATGVVIEVFVSYLISSGVKQTVEETDEHRNELDKLWADTNELINIQDEIRRSIRDAEGDTNDLQQELSELEREIDRKMDEMENIMDGKVEEFERRIVRSVDNSRP